MRSYLYVAILIMSLILSGCVANTGNIKFHLDQAAKVRLEVEANPHAASVQDRLDASVEHQKKAEALMEDAAKVLPIDTEGKAKIYKNAEQEATASLSEAKQALAVVTETTEITPKPTSAPVETEIHDSAGPPGPVGSDTDRKTASSASTAPVASAKTVPTGKGLSQPVGGGTDSSQTTPVPAPTLTPQSQPTQAVAAKLDLPNDPVALYKMGLGQYRVRAFVQSRQSLVALLGRYPTHSLAVNAQYWIGETYYSEKQWVLALGAFQAVLSHYPDGRKVPDALVKIGLTERNIGRMGKARAALEECIRRFPKSSAAKVAQQTLDSI